MVKVQGKCLKEIDPWKCPGDFLGEDTSMGMCRGMFGDPG